MSGRHAAYAWPAATRAELRGIAARLVDGAQTYRGSDMSAVSRRLRSLVKFEDHITDAGPDLSHRGEHLAKKYFVVSEISPYVCFEVERSERILRAVFLDEVPEGSEFAEFDRDGVGLVLHVHGPTVLTEASSP